MSRFNRTPSAGTPDNVVQHPSSTSLPSSSTGFFAILNDKLTNFQDWIAFIALVLTIIALCWSCFTYALDGKLSAIEKQTTANYEKLSAEQREQAAIAKSDFLELKALIQEMKTN